MKIVLRVFLEAIQRLVVLLLIGASLVVLVLISSAINGSIGVLAICSASRFRSARFPSELLFLSNKFRDASSEHEESNTGRCTGADRGLTAGATTLGGSSGAAGGAAAASPADGLPRKTFMVTLTGSFFHFF